MADQKCMAILLELILSIITCIQLHVTMLSVHGEYSKYEAICEYKVLKAVTQNRDFFYKWRQVYTVDMCVCINYYNWILRSFGRSHITKQCACSTAGAIILPPFLRFVWTGENDSNTLRVDANFFKNGGKNLRSQKYPHTCGQGLCCLKIITS